MASSGPPRSSLKLADGRRIAFPAVMGILNVTPDSFSDGGCFLDPDRALEHALAMESAGAAIIDVGGESTRPAGAHAVSVEEELRRIAPVLDRLAGRLRAPISIDTRKAVVAQAALDRGVAIINDVSALTADPAMAALAARRRSAVVLMHMRGGPEDHMRHARYRDVVREVIDYLRARAQFAIRSGVLKSRIVLDPGIGFAKQAPHNLALLGSLSRVCALGYPVLVGASRKHFIRRIAGAEAAQVTSGNAAVHALAIAAGAAIIRVHDVAAAAAALKMAEAITAARRSTRSAVPRVAL